MSAPTTRISRPPRSSPAAGGKPGYDRAVELALRAAARSVAAGAGVTGIAGVDTRALTSAFARPAPRRRPGVPGGRTLRPRRSRAQAEAWPGLEGMDLAKEVCCRQSYIWDETPWAWPVAPAGKGPAVSCRGGGLWRQAEHPALPGVDGVSGDGGAGDDNRRGILRHKPDGVFLSNGPGDPAATGAYAVPALREVLATGVPVFGICLGHQLLGWRWARAPTSSARPSRCQPAGKGSGHRQSRDHQSEPWFCAGWRFAAEKRRVTHVSLFDGSNEGLLNRAAGVFVQYHPEASPGPSDSHHLFARFVQMMSKAPQQHPAPKEVHPEKRPADLA